MADFPSLPLMTDAYIADTQHLTNEEHGIYLRLMMFAWRTPTCSLPDDDARIAIMVGLTKAKWLKFKPVITAFWTLKESGWEQKKLTKTREYVEKNTQQKSQAGKASARAKSLKRKEAGSTAEPTAKQHPKPKPKPKEPNGSIPPIGGTDLEDKIINLSERKEETEELDKEFEAVWDHYPRKVGKGAALKEWLRARKSNSFADITKPLGQFIRAIHGTEMSKIPHFRTWLHQERWKDDQSHAFNGNTTSDAQLDALNAGPANSPDAELDGLFPAGSPKALPTPQEEYSQ